MPLLSFFRRTRTEGTPPPKNSAKPDGFGLDDVFGRPEYQDRLRNATNLLSYLDLDAAHNLVRDTARRFLAYVVDLPASEKHHHSEPFGLFTHSLHVAELAVRAAISHHFVTDTRAYPDEQEYRVPRLRYAAWFFGLLHDAGKFAQVQVRGPEMSRWNPYLEPLEAFYNRHGRETCQLYWTVGRGLDTHVWQNAFLMGHFLSNSVASYLGPKITAEMIERQTPSAQEVEHLISDADHRSSREGLARKADPDANGSASTFVGGGDFVDRIPEVLAHAIREQVLKIIETGADLYEGQLLIGSRFVLLRYPEGVKKLAFLCRQVLGREFSAARALHPTDQGALELARALHETGKLFSDPETDTWKLKAKVRDKEAFNVVDGILIPRTFLEPGLQQLSSVPVFPGEVRFARSEDDAAIAVDDWKSSSTPGHSHLGPPAKTAVTPPAKPRTPAAPTPPAMPALPAGPSLPEDPPLVGLRQFVNAEVLLRDIRGAILQGVIPSNLPGKPCYVLPEVTYLASPRGFQILVQAGLYAHDPKRELNIYLDALASLPMVRKKPGGRVLTAVELRPGQKQALWVVAFETRGLFRSETEIARAGIYTETPIRELSDDDPRLSKPRRSEAPVVNTGVAHA